MVGEGSSSVFNSTSKNFRNMSRNHFGVVTFKNLKSAYTLISRNRKFTDSLLHLQEVTLTPKIMFSRNCASSVAKVTKQIIRILSVQHHQERFSNHS